VASRRPGDAVLRYPHFEVALAWTLRRFAWYQRVHAWALWKGCPRHERAVEPAKRSLIGRLSGLVVEIGPGAGACLRYYGQGVHWIGIEPNPHAHAYLEARARECGLDATVRLGVAERLPMADRSVDAVVSSLVLCTVDDLDSTLREIRRVLKPGGRFVFIEHVAAPAGTWLRLLQRVVRWPQGVLADGCRPDRETWRAIEAAGFARVITCHDHLPVPVVGPHIMGMAVK
jgi:SAM-dependent methyltransferase